MTMSGFQKALRRYGAIFSEEAAQIAASLISSSNGHEQAEIVATLYAVWKDQLASRHRRQPTTHIRGVLRMGLKQAPHRSGPSSFRSSWMRDKGLVPTG